MWIIPHTTHESKNRGNSVVGRRAEEVTRRRRRIGEERRVSGDECREVKSIGAEKQMRQRAG